MGHWQMHTHLRGSQQWCRLALRPHRTESRGCPLAVVAEAGRRGAFSRQVRQDQQCRQYRQGYLQLHPHSATTCAYRGGQRAPTDLSGRNVVGQPVEEGISHLNKRGGSAAAAERALAVRAR